MFTGRRCGGRSGHRLAVDGDQAAIGRDEARDHPQQRGLAAARPAEQGHEGAGGDGEFDPADREGGAVALGQPLEMDGAAGVDRYWPVLMRVQVRVKTRRTAAVCRRGV